MSNTVKHFGIINSGVIEQPESGSWYLSQEGKVTTLKYIGNKEKIEAFVDALVNVHTTLGNKGLPKISKDEGNVWTLEVLYTLPWAGNNLVKFPNRANPYIQYSTQDIQKPLESLPRFALVSSGGIPNAGRVVEFEAWKNAPISRRVKFQYSLEKEPDVTDDSDWHDLLPLQEDLAKRILAGQDSYLIGSQIITQVTVFSVRPMEGAVNKDYKIASPPSGHYTSNQKYLQKPSSLSQGQDGTWTMTETWTGADYWDTEIYGNA